jgi:hypothetical protein
MNYQLSRPPGQQALGRSRPEQLLQRPAPAARHLLSLLQMEKLNQRQLLQRNCELLRVCFNVLQSLIKERQTEKSTLSYCDSFNMSLATKYVHERWEREKRQLEQLGPAMVLTEFAGPAELPVPQLDAAGWKEHLQRSSFYNQHFNKK